MKITASSLQQYTLPLARPLTTGISQTTTRQGIVLTLHSDNGLQGYGEIAPMPGLHKESLPEAAEQLVKYRPILSEIPITPDKLSFNGHLSQCLPTDLLPSVRSGIEMAILDVVLQTESVPMHLPPALPINALLDADEKPVTEHVEELLLQGFSCIKIKVGRQPLEDDINDVAAVESITRGKAWLRLDANRRWTLQEAKRFCDAIDLRGIEYIEEPTRDAKDHIELFECCHVPIALDETLTELALCQLDGKRYRAVVLKPAMLGGFEKTAQIIRWARQNQITPVISSAFQTSLTTRMYLVFAAINEITQTPLGLDTGKWFREDLLLTPPEIINGKMPIPSFKDRPKLRQEFLQSLESEC